MGSSTSAPGTSIGAGRTFEVRAESDLSYRIVGSTGVKGGVRDSLCVPNACFMLPSRNEGVLETGALLMEGLDAELEDWSFHRLDMDGNLRLIRDANDSLLRSLELRSLNEVFAERSQSSPGVHSGVGDTTADRASWPL